MKRLVGWTLVLVGAVWLGQGIGLIGGSPMTGSAFWAVAGAFCLLAGATLVYRGRRAP